MPNDFDQSAAPPITIVIANRDRLTRACRALLSVARQDHPAIDLVLVDDGSRRDMRPVVDLVAALGGRVIENRGTPGAAAARNLGIDAAAGRWVAFLDSDDWFAPDKLTRQIATARAEAGSEAAGQAPGTTAPPADAIGCGLWFEKAGRLFRFDQPPLPEGHPISDFLYADGGLLQTSTLMIRRTALDRHRFDPDLPVHQETDLLFRLTDAGARLRLAPDPLVVMAAGGQDRITMDAGRIAVARDWYEARRADWSPAAQRGFLREDLAMRTARAGRVGSTLGLLARAAGRDLPPKAVLSILAIAVLGEGRAESLRRRIGALRREPNAAPALDPLTRRHGEDTADAQAIVAGRLAPAAAVAARRQGHPAAP